MGSSRGADEERRKSAWWQGRATRWFGGIATAVVTALVVAYATNVFGPDSTASSVPGAAGPPVTVAATLGGDGCGWGLFWVIPESVDRLPSFADLTSPADKIAAADAHHGVLADGSEITLVVQAPTDRAVVLTGMHVLVSARRPAVKGIYTASGGCGGVGARWFLLDNLDADPVAVTPQEGRDQSGRSVPAVTFPYKVSATDPEVFVVVPEAVSHDVDFELELDWVADGKAGKTIVSDAGKPFRFTGTSAALAYEFSGNNGWVPGGLCEHCVQPSSND